MFLISLLGGLAPFEYLLTAAGVGVLLFVLALLGLSFRDSVLVRFIGFAVVVFGHSFAKKLSPHHTFAYSLQWLCILLAACVVLHIAWYYPFRPKDVESKPLVKVD